MREPSRLGALRDPDHAQLPRWNPGNKRVSDADDEEKRGSDDEERPDLRWPERLADHWHHFYERELATAVGRG